MVLNSIYRAYGLSRFEFFIWFSNNFFATHPKFSVRCESSSSAISCLFFKHFSKSVKFRIRLSLLSTFLVKDLTFFCNFETFFWTLSFSFLVLIMYGWSNSIDFCTLDGDGSPCLTDGSINFRFFGDFCFVSFFCMYSGNAGKIDGTASFHSLRLALVALKQLFVKCLLTVFSWNEIISCNSLNPFTIEFWMFHRESVKGYTRILLSPCSTAISWTRSDHFV